MITGQIMHQQSPINTSRQIADPCFDIRLCLWSSWGAFLPGILILLLPFSNGISLPASIALPFPLTLHLILMSPPLLLLLLSRGAWLDRTARHRSLPTFALAAVGLELYATLSTVFLRATFDIVTDLPMPELDFLFTHRHSLIGGSTLLVLLYAFFHGLVLPDEQPASRPAVLLRLYIVTRPLVGLALGFPLDGELLAWLVAAALPIGLGLGLGAACLINRFRPPPESLPPPGP